MVIYLLIFSFEIEIEVSWSQDCTGKGLGKQTAPLVFSLYIYSLFGRDLSKEKARESFVEA